MPLIDVLNEKNLTRFLDLLEEAEMMDELAKMSDITVFAPSNDAIDELEQEYMDTIMVTTYLYLYFHEKQLIYIFIL